MKNTELFGERVRVVAYIPSLAHLMGNDPDAALLLCQFLYWQGKQHDPKGWIRKSQSQLMAETALTRSRQESARKWLRQLEFIEEIHVGKSPPVIGFRLCLDKITQAWGAYQIDPKGVSAQNKAAKACKSKRTQPGNVSSETAKHRAQKQLDEETQRDSMNSRLSTTQSALSQPILCTGDNNKDDNRDDTLLPLSNVSSSARVDDNREVRLLTSASTRSVEKAKSARLDSAAESRSAAAIAAAIDNDDYYEFDYFADE